MKYHLNNIFSSKNWQKYKWLAKLHFYLITLSHNSHEKLWSWLINRATLSLRGELSSGTLVLPSYSLYSILSQNFFFFFVRGSCGYSCFADGCSGCSLFRFDDRDCHSVPNTSLVICRDDRPGLSGCQVLFLYLGACLSL